MKGPTVEVTLKLVSSEKAGLPPDAAPGRFVGFDADGDPFVLRWGFGAGGGWYGIGFEAVPYSHKFSPIALFGDDLAARIKSHVEIPRTTQ